MISQRLRAVLTLEIVNIFYDHQVQIKIESAGDDGKGDRCNSAVVYGDKLSLLLTFFLVLTKVLL